MQPPRPAPRGKLQSCWLTFSMNCRPLASWGSLPRPALPTGSATPLLPTTAHMQVCQHPGSQTTEPAPPQVTGERGALGPNNHSHRGQGPVPL